MTLKRTKLTLLGVFLAFSTFAQVTSFKAIVVDETNAPVIGAYVLQKASDNHAHSNELGEFTIYEVAVGDTLIISSIGYSTTEFMITQLEEVEKLNCEPISAEEDKNISQIVFG